MDQNLDRRSEAEVDSVLRLASQPELPSGATGRLMTRIAADGEDNVVLFRPRKVGPRPGLLRYAAALPLAASLALGIYLGAKGDLDFAFPSVVTGAVASADDTIDDLGGVGEAEQYAEDNLL